MRTPRLDSFARALLGFSAAASLFACGGSGSGTDRGDDQGGDGKPDAATTRERPDARPFDPVPGGGDGGGGGGEDDPSCGVLPVTVRDFKRTHADFETFGGNEETPGLLKSTLDANRLPQFLTGVDPREPGRTQITSKTTFDQWYRDVPNVNSTVRAELKLTPDGNGNYVYDAKTGGRDGFFPVDDLGFKDRDRDVSGNLHNFHFTTEVHTSFEYKGGEVFQFSGDDDLWLFIDGKLALDLGGVHHSVDGTVELGKLGLVEKTVYKMDIFHAERRTNESNFKITTTIECLGPVD